MDNKLSAPLSTLQWVNRDSLKPNDYNPNKVSKENLKLLIQSILTNGWTLPIVVRPDMTIIDGFHRWTVAGMEPLRSKLDGKVPVVVVEHKEHSEDIYGTVTHNRARGTHLLEPMKKIIKELTDGNVVVAADGTAPLLGVSIIEGGYNDISGVEAGKVKKGQDVDILIKDIGFVIASAEIKKGQEVTATTGGKAAVAAAGDYVIGVALNNVSAGGYSRLQLSKYQKAKS